MKLFCRKFISFILLLTFGLSMVVAPATPSGAQLLPAGSVAGLPNLPAPGQAIWLTPVFQPPVLRGMTVHPENPLLFDFIVDRGQDKINNDLLKDESTKLIKYFLASMTIPDKDAWVNLSPYEKDRIIPDALGQTEMGRQMLEQDYVLKQLSASLTNPDKELGQKFWNEVKARAQKQFGTTDIPLNTFNKVWIVPDGATVVEKDGFAYITESKLKVMLDEDYVAASSLRGVPAGNDEAILEQIASQKALAMTGSDARNDEKETAPRNDVNSEKEKGTVPFSVSQLSTAVFREMILPKLVEEVNTGKNFAQTRQVYQSVILAAWYKKALKDSLLGKIYADKSKVEGVESDVKDIKQKVYDQYLEAFKKGVYNVIKEDEDASGDLIPRKYFSGGYTFEGFVPRVSSSAVDVNRAVVEVNSGADNGWLTIVAAGVVEGPGEENAIKTGSNFFEGLKRLLLTAMSAMIISGSLAGGSFAADFPIIPEGPNQIPSYQLVIKPGDTWKGIVEQEIGASLGQYPNGPEILDKSLSILRAENPGLGDLRGGETLKYTGAKNYLEAVSVIQSSNIFSIDRFHIGSETFPVYAFNFKDQKPYPNEFMALQFTAFSLGEQGAFLNIPLIVYRKIISQFDINKEMLPNNPDQASEHGKIFAGMTFREVFDLYIADNIRHELFHSYFDKYLRQSGINTKPYEKLFEMAKKSATYGNTVHEVAAFLGELALSPNPKAVIDEFITKLRFTSATVPGGERYYYSAQIIMGILQQKLGYNDFFVQQFLAKMQDSLQRPLTIEEKARYSEAALDLIRQKIRDGLPNSYKIQDFIDSLDGQAFRDAARQAFEEIVGQPIPQIDPVTLAPEVITKIMMEHPEYLKLFRLKFDNDGRITMISDTPSATAGTSNNFTLILDQLNLADIKPEDKQKLNQELANQFTESGPGLISITPNFDPAKPVLLLIHGANDKTGAFKFIDTMRDLYKDANLVAFQYDDSRPLKDIAADLNRLWSVYVQGKQIRKLIVEAYSYGYIVARAAAHQNPGNINADKVIAVAPTLWGSRRALGSEYAIAQYILDYFGNKNLADAQNPNLDDQKRLFRSGFTPFRSLLIISVGDDSHSPRSGDPEDFRNNVEKAKNEGDYLFIPEASHGDAPSNAKVREEVRKAAASSGVGDAETASAPTNVAAQAVTKDQYGGIDFDPSKLNLQIKRDGHGVPLPLPQQNLENIDINGLYPVIINIMPINSQTLPILGQLDVQPAAAPFKG